MRYPLDDFIYFIGKHKPSQLCTLLHFIAIVCFSTFVVMEFIPAFISLKSSHKIFSTFEKIKTNSDILSNTIRRDIKEYKNKRNKINAFLAESVSSAPNYVFDKILSLLGKSQIHDVILNIGHIHTKKEKTGLTLMLVPVRIKAYVEYAKLKDFFAALNKSTVYTLDKMEISWSNKHLKDSIEIDMTVILKYQNKNGEINRL